MKKLSRMIGVTLLEVMLVLAVAAMIIVMSVRYYQTASANQQVNSMLSMIQAISSAADGLAQGSGSYTTGGVCTGTAIADLMPNESLVTAWGGSATLSACTSNTYTVTISAVPKAVCQQVKSKLTASSKFTAVTSTCTSATSFSYTYDAQQ